MLNVPILVADNGKNFARDNSIKNIISVTDFIPKNSLDTGKKGNGALTVIAGTMQYLQGQNGTKNANPALMKFLKSVKYKTVDLPKKWQDLANFNTINEFK